ncbi:MAG: sugar phosphate isomerase/epimerase [Lentisphaeria bacterium]|nr:sugar phosphate isomerase/epimerase [Lentisphaeria bacterium]
MKLATSSVMFEDQTIEQVCERVAGLGLAGLDIWAPFENCVHLEDIRKRLGGKGLRELMTRHGLDVAAFTIYDGNKLSQYWELIRDFGGGVVVRSSEAGRLTDPKELVPRMRALFEQLKPDIELAEKCDARLAIENYGGEVLSSVDTFKAFVELNPNPERLGIALAPYHLQYYETPIEDVIRIAGSQIFFFYAWQHGADVAQMPGLGPVDFTPLIRALAEINYAHYSSIFMHGHLPTDETETAVSKSREYLLNINSDQR